MRQITTEAFRSPAEPLDPEVLEFRSQFDPASPLDELVRQGAQQMLQSAIEMEVDDFLAQHANRRDGRGHQLVIRNGYLPSREILTGAGRLSVEQPRVRDQSPCRRAIAATRPSGEATTVSKMPTRRSSGCRFNVTTSVELRKALRAVIQRLVVTAVRRVMKLPFWRAAHIE
jgi:Transposase, Mutator family